MPVLLCVCAWTRLFPEKIRKRLTDALALRDGVEIVPDLCRLAAEDRKSLRSLFAPADLLVLACEPRAIRSLLDWAGVPPAPGLRLVNARRAPVAEVLDLLPPPVRSAAAPVREVRPEGKWHPWFPVIDRERCSGCGQCAAFCLFGVYAPGPPVQVVRPANCKTNCPACARLCPRGAVIFPKHPEAPIDGAEIRDEAEIRARAAEAEKTLLGDDPLAALAERRRKRKSILGSGGE